jgi:hypothetical protein
MCARAGHSTDTRGDGTMHWSDLEILGVCSIQPMLSVLRQGLFSRDE